jgi:hypothetical protein
MLLNTSRGVKKYCAARGKRADCNVSICTLSYVDHRGSTLSPSSARETLYSSSTKAMGLTACKPTKLKAHQFGKTLGTLATPDALDRGTLGADMAT